MQKAQGSLEYLVLIAVVLAIISVVTMIAVGYIGSQQGKYSYNTCKNAAANCKAALAANPNDKCGYCDVECKNPDGTDISTKASTCCKMGKPDSVYEGATGDDCNACFSDTDCTPQLCNPLTKKCVTPACMTANDPVCPDPNPATTGDGLCVSRLCVNPGAYNAYCDTGGKKESTSTVCQTTISAWTCKDSNTAQRTTTTMKCDGLGSCSVVSSQTTETKTCQAGTQIDVCSSPIPGYETIYGYNMKRTTTTYACDPATVDSSGGQCKSTQVVDDKSCQTWYCLCAVCFYHTSNCAVPAPTGTGGCTLASVGCMNCAPTCGFDICLTSALCHVAACTYCR